MNYFYSYQKDYYNSNARFKIINKSRQIGMSEIAAFTGLQTCLKYNRDILFVSSSQRQSNLVMDKIEKFIDVHGLEYLAKTGLKYKLLQDSKTQKTFSNKKSIYCLPSSPETIRSFSGDVIIDEFAFHREDRKIYSALLPVITRGYNISIISTPLGQSNMFYEIFTDINNYKDYERTEINCYAAQEQGFNIDIDSIQRNIDEESFRQEYLCEFIDEQTSYFTYDLLKTCVTDIDINSIKGKCYIGIDIGRSHDLTAISIIRESNGIFYLTRLETLKNVRFDLQKETISMIIRNEQPEKVLIDKGAIGMQLAEELVNDYCQCEGVQFTVNLKNELVTNCKKLIEQNKFKFAEDRNLISDFHKIKRTVTSRNQTNFDSIRDSSGHSDTAWACMLALLCHKSEIEYTMRIL